MKVMFYGYQDIDFTGRDGKRVDGVKLHYSGIDPSVFGRTCENQYVVRHVVDSFDVKVSDMNDLLGAEVNIDFNGKGKIVGFGL
jgi:hypothetical protein